MALAYGILAVAALLTSVLGVEFPGPVAIFVAIGQMVVFALLEIISPQKFNRLSPKMIAARVAVASVAAIIIAL